MTDYDRLFIECALLIFGVESLLYAKLLIQATMYRLA